MANPIEPVTARGAFAVTNSDTAILPRVDALWVGGIGNVAVRMLNGSTVTFTAVPAGTLLPIAVDQVLATGTTATAIVALHY